MHSFGTSHLDSVTHTLFDQSEHFWRTSLTNNPGQSERAETQKHWGKLLSGDFLSLSLSIIQRFSINL